MGLRRRSIVPPDPEGIRSANDRQRLAAQQRGDAFLVQKVLPEIAAALASKKEKTKKVGYLTVKGAAGRVVVAEFTGYSNWLPELYRLLTTNPVYRGYRVTCTGSWLTKGVQRRGYQEVALTGNLTAAVRDFLKKYPTEGWVSLEVFV